MGGGFFGFGGGLGGRGVGLAGVGGLVVEGGRGGGRGGVVREGLGGGGDGLGVGSTERGRVMRKGEVWNLPHRQRCL